METAFSQAPYWSKTQPHAHHLKQFYALRVELDLKDYAYSYNNEAICFQNFGPES